MKKRRSEPKTKQEKRREEKKRQEKGREDTRGGRREEEDKKIYKKVSTFNNWTCLTCGVCWPSSSLLFLRHFFGRMV